MTITINDESICQENLITIYISKEVNNQSVINKQNMSLREIHKENNPDSNIIIRRAIQDDVEALIDISRVSFRNQLIWCTKHQARKWWKYIISSQFSETWIFQSNGQVAGYLRLVTDPVNYKKEEIKVYPKFHTLIYVFCTHPWFLFIKIVEKIVSITSKTIRYVDIEDLNISDDRTAWAHFMAVTPKMRNRGIGTSMIKFRDQRALELGFYVIKMWIEKKRKVSIKLNEKNGFIKTGKYGNFYVFIKVLPKINNIQSDFSKV